MDGHPTPAEKTIMRKLSQPFGKDMDKVPLDDFFKYDLALLHELLFGHPLI